MILNTKTKTITPEGETFGEIYQELQKMRPDDWREFTLAPTIVTVEKWTTYPVYPDTTPLNPYAPSVPYPIVTWCGSSGISTSDIICMALASSVDEINNCCKTAN